MPLNYTHRRKNTAEAVFFFADGCLSFGNPRIFPGIILWLSLHHSNLRKLYRIVFALGTVLLKGEKILPQNPCPQT